ncbi:MAG: hypothetical protein KGZ58_09945 [Ignavibacteriales bacterium]|nr:hypothetical protein [Ignavibacteriales bacterium]
MKKYFREQGWIVKEKNENQELIIEVEVETESGQWSCIANVDSNNVFMFFSVFPGEIPNNKRDSVVKFLEKENIPEENGCFSIIEPDGVVYYTTGLDLNKEELSTERIHDIVGRNVITMNLYIPLIKKIIGVVPFPENIEPNDELQQIERADSVNALLVYLVSYLLVV